LHKHWGWAKAPNLRGLVRRFGMSQTQL